MGGHWWRAVQVVSGTRVRLSRLAALTVAAVAAGALLAASGSATTAHLSAASNQVPVFLRVSNMAPDQSVELKFDASSVQLVGVKVGATPGASLVQLLNNDFVLQSDSDRLISADVSLSAENVGAMITGTAQVPAGVQVVALGEPQTTITTGRFSFSPEFRSAPLVSRVADSPSRVRAGKSVTVHGTVEGCARGNRVAVTSRAFSDRREFDGLPAIFPTVRDGVYSVRTTIPSSDRSGVYAVSARCGKRVLASAHLTVTAG